MKVTSRMQYEFFKDIVSLFIFAMDLCEEGVFDRCVLGEAWRRPEMQRILKDRGWSNTLSSRHMVKLAVDLFFWQDGRFIRNVPKNKAKLQDVGDYWESRNPNNVWGGNFKTLLDISHYEKKY